jgi:hypothetical protein
MKMFRLCFSALVVAILLSLSGVRIMAGTVTIDDEGCIPGGERFGYQMIYRIVIWDGDNLSYLEEIPCGSGRWLGRGRVSGAPPTRLNNPGVLTSSGTIEFSQSSHTAGIITEGTGPDNRGFMPIATQAGISIQMVQTP